MATGLYPAYVKQRLAASGGVAPIHLLDILQAGGQHFNWGSESITLAMGLGVPSESGPGLVYPVQTYNNWIISAGPFVRNKSVKGGRGQCVIQNVSGNTVQRDVSLVYLKSQILGALVLYRAWKADCAYATYTFAGRIISAPIQANGMSMTLNFESIDSWATTRVPYKQIGPNCPLTFGSIECGSTSGTVCNNDYGTCSSTNRFQGCVQEWTGATVDTTQYVQPAPLTIVNGRIAG